MILTSTLRHRVYVVTIDADRLFIHPPPPRCEVCEHDQYTLSITFDAVPVRALVCTGCGAQYPLREEIQL